MTRKEEREKASIEYQMSISPVAIGGAAFAEDIEKFNINPSFVAGAQWADETMIEKACEWLKENAYFYVNDYTGSLNEDRLVENFKNYMKRM